MNLRFNDGRRFLAALCKGFLRVIQKIPDQFLENCQFFFTGVGKAGVIVGQFCRDPGNIDRLVSQPFKLCGHLVILVQHRNMELTLKVRKQFHQVAAQMVCQPVDLHFPGRNLLLPGPVVFFHLQLRFFKVFPGKAEHRPQHVIAALERQRGCGKEHRIQRLDQFPVRVFLFFLLTDNLVAQFFKDAKHRQQADRADEVKHGIGIGNHAGIDRGVP